VCPQAETDGQFFNVVPAVIEGNGSAGRYTVGLAPGPNAIARPAGSGPPSSYSQNDPAAANTNDYEIWLDDRPGMGGDGDYNDIGFGVTLTGDGFANVRVLRKDAGDTFDLVDSTTGQVVIANAGSGGSSARIAAGKASYGINGFPDPQTGKVQDYHKLVMKPDKVIAMDYSLGGITPTDDPLSWWPDNDRNNAPKWARHTKKANVLFGDASVQSVPWQEINYKDGKQGNIIKNKYWVVKID